MIYVDLPATMECVEDDCSEQLRVKLVLTIGGTLVGKMPNGHGWQLQSTGTGVLLCRCPKHHVGPDRVLMPTAGLDPRRH